MRGLKFQKKTRIVVVDDNYDHATGIRELINLESGFEVIANAGNAGIAISLIKKYKPDIVLLDMNMPEVDGITALARIRNLNLDTRVIALTAYDDPDLIFRAVKAGARGYVLKTMASHHLIQAIEDVYQGKVYLPSVICTKFVEFFQSVDGTTRRGIENESLNRLNELTSRELEVLHLLTQGVTYRGVSQKLFISETTVKTHVNNIFQKLQVNDRTQAVLYAIRNGILEKQKMKIA